MPVTRGSLANSCGVTFPLKGSAFASSSDAAAEFVCPSGLVPDDGFADDVVSGFAGCFTAAGFVIFGSGFTTTSPSCAFFTFHQMPPTSKDEIITSTNTRTGFRLDEDPISWTICGAIASSVTRFGSILRSGTGGLTGAGVGVEIAFAVSAGATLGFSVTCGAGAAGTATFASTGFAAATCAAGTFSAGRGAWAGIAGAANP